MNNKPQQLVLASTSKPRQNLLQRLQIPFEIVAPDVDETPLPGETPEQLVQRLALQKAEVVAKKFPEALIIGADQVGVLDNKILGKPLTYENAFKQLREASGKTINFYIGMSLLNGKTQQSETILETFGVRYRNLTDAQIASYLKKEAPLECAGSCKVEGLGIALIDSFEGADFTALIGLPLIRLVNLLENAGLSPIED